jgi:hypothetical protein
VEAFNIMTDVFLTMLVVMILAALIAIIARYNPRSLRPLIWLALLEYMLCTMAQLIYSRVVVEGGDALYYARTGAELARLLDTSYNSTSRELVALLFQQPSRLDAWVYGAGQNTGSMSAAVAWLLYFLGGSDYAMHVLVSGLSLLAALSIFTAFRDADPSVSPRRLFVATVLFPSVAFWTSALHKEAFCLMGIGAVLAAWRGIYRRRWLRVLAWGPLGVGLILVFRAPAFPPLILGLGVFYALERLQRLRGTTAEGIGPLYLVLALAVIATGMVLATRVSPSLALGQLGETVAARQQNWLLTNRVAGGSVADVADVTDAANATLGAQIRYVPLALFNALLRPQLFDVHNFGTLVSALEMSTILWLTISAVRYRGIRGVFSRIQRSPFLLMCAVITTVGCTLVGLVTFNLGSLARYRVPFLPFYGALILVLSDRATYAASSSDNSPLVAGRLDSAT